MPLPLLQYGSPSEGSGVILTNIVGLFFAFRASALAEITHSNSHTRLRSANHCFLGTGWKLSQSSASGCGIYPVKSTPRNPSAELNLPFSSDRFASGTTWKKPTRWSASKSSICRHPRGRFIGRAKLPSCWPQRREHLPLQLTSWRRKMIRFSPLNVRGSTPLL